jgi:hypothetical protein
VHGFARDVSFEGSIITEWAVRLGRARDPWPRLAAAYEREDWRLQHELSEHQAVVLSQLAQLKTSG